MRTGRSHTWICARSGGLMGGILGYGSCIARSCGIDMDFTNLLGIGLPVTQAPMAGVQGSALAVAVSNAGGLGSLPCAMLAPDAMRHELAAIRAHTERPYNVDFFCHTPPAPDERRETGWREALSPYYREFGIDPAGIAAGPGRLPFNAEAAEVLEAYRPPVVSFHFGLPGDELL